MLQAFQDYILAFYEAEGGDTTGARYVGFFGANFVLNAIGYPGFDQRGVIVNFSNPIDFWLANIGQRMAWDNLAAIRFWVVNTLLLELYSRSHANYLSIDIRDYTRDRVSCVRRLQEFLGLDSGRNGESAAPDGFIRFDEKLVATIERNASDLRKIYEDHADYQLALHLPEWASEFLAQPEHQRLLLEYRDFWNSSSHTNLDWIGPLEHEIVDRALDSTGFRTRRNLSCWFYHECFTLKSDHYEEPRSHLEHYLGSLEEKIILPVLPYYARVAACYLESVAGNYLKRAYSAIPIRRTNLYQRMAAPEYRAYFKRWALEEKWAAVEKAIDLADEAIAKF